MAKKRTKKQKMRTQQHKSNKVLPRLPLSQENVAVQVSEHKLAVPIATTSPKESVDLLGYPTALLYKDLVRSLAITVLLVVLLLGMFFYIQYN